MSEAVDIFASLRHPQVARPFPFAPLLEASKEPSYHRLALRIGASGSTVRDALVRGCTDEQADRWACALGLHPSEVWGDQWFKEAPAWTEDA